MMRSIAERLAALRGRRLPETTAARIGDQTYKGSVAKAGQHFRPAAMVEADDYGLRQSPARSVDVGVTGLPECIALPRLGKATSLQGVAQAYDSLQIPIGIGTKGREIAWPIRQVPHCVIVKQVDGIGLSTMLRTIVAAAACAGMCVVIADFTDEDHDDFAGFRRWPNIHLAVHGRYGAARAIDYVAETVDRRRASVRVGHASSGPLVNHATEVPDYAPILLVVHGLDAAVGRLNEPDGPIVRIDQMVERIVGIGREFRVHTAVSYERGGVDRHLAVMAGMKVQIGPLNSRSSRMLWGGVDVGESLSATHRGRGVASLNGEQMMALQGYLTPDPMWKNRSDTDNDVLDAVRPSTSLYPRVVIDLPNSVTNWTDVWSAPVVIASSRPDLDETF